MAKVICAQCRHPVVPPEGPEHAEILIVGQDPGAQEYRVGRPFVGPSGKLLRATLKEIGLENDPEHLSSVRITNSRRCKCPRDREAILREIREVGPTLIVALGREALEAIAGEERGILKSEGAYLWIEDIPGWVLPVRHPAAVLRAPTTMQDFLRALEKAPRFLKHFDPLTQPKFTVVRDIKTALQALDTLRQYDLVAYDIETTGLNPSNSEILCLGLACWRGNRVSSVVILTADVLKDARVKAQLRRRFEEPHRWWVAHNAKFDNAFLTHHLGSCPVHFHDTMIESYVLDERPGAFGYHDLKVLAQFYLDAPDWEAPLKDQKKKGFGDVSEELLHPYLAFDVAATLALHKHLIPKVAEEQLESVYDLVIRAAKAFATVDSRGIYIDLDYARALEKRYREQLQRITDEISSHAGEAVNPASVPQMRRLLFEILGFPVIARTPKGAASTNKEVIAELVKRYPGDPVLNALEEHRRIIKLLGTYVLPFSEEATSVGDGLGKLYVETKVTGTVTGRFAQSRPAVITTPRNPEIRRMFVAPPNHLFLSCDFSQNELRVAAYCSGDPYMIEMFKRGYDFHTAGAIAVWGENFTKEQRTLIKNLNFGWIYSGGNLMAGASPDMDSQVLARIDKTYREKMPKVLEWFNEVGDLVQRQGYVESPLGRRRRFPLITSQNLHDVRKEAVNHICQAHSSDMTFIAMERLLEGLPEFSVRWMMHDSIIGYVPESHAEEVAWKVKLLMEETGTELLEGIVPAVAEVEIGPSWGQLWSFGKEK